MRLVFVLSFAVHALLCVTVAVATPPVFLVDLTRLEAARDGQEAAARRALVGQADQLLKTKPGSVLLKAQVPASGDKHDYFSMGPYWWPDPAKPDGLPYIRRDGEVNPESRRNTDAELFPRTCGAIKVLAAAWYVTGDERYGTKAVEFARGWFLDPATRMNPNFQHAQAIPGITTGRGIGIIEARWLMDANEGLALLEGFSGWTAADRSAMRAWNEQFYTWMTTSKNALEEKAWFNNHGTWYDAQVSHLALVIGRTADAKELLTAGLTTRIAKQIEPDGRQPHELERTKSLGYSLYNLEAHLLCARLGEKVGVDAWNFTTPDGRSLRAALRFLAPYVDPEKRWIKEDLGHTGRDRLVPLLREFVARVDDPELKAALRAAESRQPNAVRPLLED